MPEPSVDLPVWATSGDVVEPGSGKKSLGWVDGEKPPAEFFNWWQNATYQWLEYFQQLTTGVEGASDVWKLLSMRVDDDPVLQVGVEPGEHTTPTSWKPILLLKTGTTREDGIWTGRDSNAIGMILAHNAYWNASTSRWVQADATKPSVALAFDDTAGTLRVWRAPIGQSPWTSWPESGNLEADTLASAYVIATNTLATASVLQIPGPTALNYASTQTVTKFVDLRQGFALTTAVQPEVYNSDLVLGSSSASDCVMEVNLDDTIPQGATVTRLRIIAEVSGGGGGCSIEGFRTVLSFSTPSYGAHATMRGAGPVSTSGTGVQTLTYTPDQNNVLDAGRCGRVRVRMQDTDSWVYPQIEVQYQYTRANIE